jgi:pimeloyl-ACP methyl ester carboxylesterase
MSHAATIGSASFRSGAIEVHEIGAGPTVGYLHGFIGNPGNGSPVLAPLAAAGDGHRVVAPSLPGFDRSSLCEDLRSLFDWVVAVSEIIDVCGLAGEPMVASSIGAMLALEVAAVRPEAFSHLVLIAPLGLWDSATPVADPFGTTLSSQRALLTADPSVTAPFFDDDPSMAGDVLVEHGVTRYTARTAAASLVWPIPEFGLSTRIHRVRCPVTLVWGGVDRLNPPSYLARYANVLADVRATNVIDGAGHLAEWDAPAEVAAIAAAALH